MFITDPGFMEEIQKCFIKEKKETVRSGDLFLNYFLKNCTSDGILFMTIKEMTAELKIPYQDLITVLRILEKRQIIYRRNGITALRKLN